MFEKYNKANVLSFTLNIKVIISQHVMTNLV